MRASGHPDQQPPSGEIAAEAASLLQDAVLTDFRQHEHQADFWFGRMLLVIECAWRLEPLDGASIDGRRAVEDGYDNWAERPRINANVRRMLRGRAVISAEVRDNGDVRLMFEKGRQLTARTNPDGIEAWSLEAGKTTYVAKKGRVIPMEYGVGGFIRVPRG